MPTKKEVIFGHHFTSIAVGSALILAFATGADGKGALKLWPLFGAVNQTLAALALIIITLYLKARGGLKWSGVEGYWRKLGLIEVEDI